MNPLIEACRNCPSNYILENTAERIKANVDSLAPSKVSSMTQVARLAGCPSSEIARIKEEVTKAIKRVDPKISREIHVLNMGLTPPRGIIRYDSGLAIRASKRLPKRG